MATGALQVAICVKYKENEKRTNSAFEEMITKISFGHNTAVLRNLTSLMIGYDQGCVFRDFCFKDYEFWNTNPFNVETLSMGSRDI